MPERSDLAALARRDLEEGFEQFALSHFEVKDDLAASAGVEYVAWEATAEQTAEFLGAPRRDRPVVVRGITFIKHDAGGVPRFRRYIDWFDLFNQLGLNGAMRPAQLGAEGDLDRLGREVLRQEESPAP